MSSSLTLVQFEDLRLSINRHYAQLTKVFAVENCELQNVTTSLKTTATKIGSVSIKTSTTTTKSTNTMLTTITKKRMTTSSIVPLSTTKSRQGRLIRSVRNRNVNDDHNDVKNATQMKNIMAKRRSKETTSSTTATATEPASTLTTIIETATARNQGKREVHHRASKMSQSHYVASYMEYGPPWPTGPEVVHPESSRRERKIDDDSDTKL